MTHEHTDPKIVKHHDRHMAIDMHCHTLTLAVEDLIRDFPEKQAERDVLVENLGLESVLHNETMMADLLPRLTEVDARLSDMDAMGVDMQALSPSPTQYYYWADRDVSTELVKLQNEKIAEMCALHPGRFVGMGAVSLQFPDVAVRQLEDCVCKYGFRGVEISSMVNGSEIADPKYSAFWAKTESLGIVVFVHPLGTSLGRRVCQYYLANLVGQPLEITLALSQLIFGGVLDKHPGLKILAAHGGGYLGSCWGRLDHGWNVRPECKTSEKLPSQYAKQIYFDSVLHAPSELARLVDQVGVGNVVVGTDYPFDMGIESPSNLIGSVEGLTSADRKTLMRKNAERLLGLHT